VKGSGLPLRGELTLRGLGMLIDDTGIWDMDKSLEGRNEDTRGKLGVRGGERSH
jgi:hypothetical protein